MTFRQVEKALIQNGWMCVRSCGSHFQYTHPKTGRMVTVPFHGNKDISIGTLKSIEKSTGLSLRLTFYFGIYKKTGYRYRTKFILSFKSFVFIFTIKKCGFMNVS